MKYKYIYTTVLSLLFCLFLTNNGMAKFLQGTVTGINGEGKKEALPKASLYWLGTNIGTVTDVAGKFKIEITEESKSLVVSYIGYDKDTIEVKDFSKSLDVELKSNLVLEGVTVNAAQPGRIMVTNSGPVKAEQITMRGLQKAACCNLSESFQTNPSVDVSFTNAVTGAKQIQMLGLQGVYIQVLNEQVPAMRGLLANLGMDYVPGPWMESIQISKGLASVTTGFESISGQINVEYKKPEESEPLFLNFYSNHLGRFEGNATSAAILSDKWSTMFFAHANMNQTKEDLNHDSFLDSPLSKQINFMNRWSYNGDLWESKTTIKALYDEKNGGQLSYWPSRDTNSYGMQIKSQRYEFITKNGFIFPGETYRSLGTVFSISHYKFNSYFNTLKYRGEENSLYARLIYQSQIFDSTHKYVAGLSFSWDNYIEVIKTFWEPKVETIPGAFFEYTNSSINNLTIMAGLRIDFPNTEIPIGSLIKVAPSSKTFITPRFHIQYKFDDNTSLRASAGKGYRITNIHAEDIGMFASSRSMHMYENQNPEEAWNYGINGSTVFNLFGKEITMNAEFYRTDFINQVIMDMEQTPTSMWIYNVKGKSYSNSFQIDLMTELFPGFTVTTAYRLNDVKISLGGIVVDNVLQPVKLVDKPMQSRQKGFINLAYATVDDDWNIDFTAEYNGSGRLVNTSSNPAPYRMENNFPSFFMFHSQITKRFDKFDIYLGGENLADFRQTYAIISADNPKGPYFEGALIWGPIVGRTIYLGARMRVF